MKRVLILLCLTILLLNVGCHNEKAEKEEAAKFLITSPMQKDTLLFKDYVCQIHSINHIELRSQERGYLQNIYVDEGQLVKKDK